MSDPLTPSAVLYLTENELDQPVYRIMREDYVISLFADRENVLSKIHKWRDKFEGFQLKLASYGDDESNSFTNRFVGQCWT